MVTYLAIALPLVPIFMLWQIRCESIRMSNKNARDVHTNKFGQLDLQSVHNFRQFLWQDWAMAKQSILLSTTRSLFKTSLKLNEMLPWTFAPQRFRSRYIQLEELYNAGQPIKASLRTATNDHTMAHVCTRAFLASITPSNRWRLTKPLIADTKSPKWHKIWSTAQSHVRLRWR